MAERVIHTPPGADMGRSLYPAGGHSAKGGGHKAALVGLGILGYAADGVKTVFSALARKGEEYEPASRDNIRKAGEAVTSTAGELKLRAGHVGDNVRHLGERRDRHFAEKVEAVLPRLNVPTRDEWNSLNARVEELSSKLEQFRAQAAENRRTDNQAG